MIELYAAGKLVLEWRKVNYSYRRFLCFFLYFRFANSGTDSKVIVGNNKIGAATT